MARPPRRATGGPSWATLVQSHLALMLALGRSPEARDIGAATARFFRRGRGRAGTTAAGGGAYPGGGLGISQTGQRGADWLQGEATCVVSGQVMRVAWYRFTATFGGRRNGYIAIVLLIGLTGGIAIGSLAAARRTQASFAAFLASTNPRI